MAGMTRSAAAPLAVLAALLMTACVGRPSIGGLGLPWLTPTPLANKARPHQPKRAELAEESLKATLRAIGDLPTTTSSNTYRVGERAWAKRGETMFSVRRVMASRKPVAAMALRDFRQPCRRVSDEMKGLAPDKRRDTDTPRDRSDSLVCRSTLLAGMFSKRCRSPEPEAPWDPDTAAVGAAGDDELACKEEPLSLVRARRGQRFRLAGMVSDGAADFYAVEIPTGTGNAYLLIDGGGYLRRSRYLGWRPAGVPKLGGGGTEVVLMRPSVRLESGLALFRLEHESVVVAGSGGQVHYEVVYNGLSRDSRGTSYHLIYKEYRAENPDEPIHIRDLGYETDQRRVEIVGVNLQVDEVSESRILYTVIGD